MVAIYTQAQVEEHNTKGNLWMVIHNKVYDVSTFAEDVSDMKVTYKKDKSHLTFFSSIPEVKFGNTTFNRM